MKTTILARLRTLLASAATAGLITAVAGPVIPAAQADDIEVFFGNPAEQVNILFIIDTSWSMWSTENTADVDFDELPQDGSGTPYTSWAAALDGEYGAPACNPNSVFLAPPSPGNRPAPLPTCTGADVGITNDPPGPDVDHFKCNAGGINVNDALRTNGLWNTTSASSFQVAQNNGSWILANALDLATINSRDILTACRVNGVATTDSSPAAPSANNRWKAYDGILYSGDYLNYDAYKRRATGLRITLAKQAVIDSIRAVQATNKNVNFGLMRYNAPDTFDCGILPTNGPACNKTDALAGTNGECADPTGTGGGGMIVAPVRPLNYLYQRSPGNPNPNNGSLLRDYTQAWQSANPTYPGSGVSTMTHFRKLEDLLNDQVLVQGSGASSCDLPLFTPNGRTPLSESLYEAYLYFNGLMPEFGGASRPGVSSSNTWISDYTSLKMGDGSYPTQVNDPSSSTLRYRSPSLSCSRNAVILLSDGGTQADGVDTKIKSVIQNLTPGATYDSREKTGVAADGTLDPDAQFPSGFNFSEYVDDFTKALHESNQLDTYVVGYKVKETYQDKLLERMAENGGGEYFSVNEPDKLLDAFNRAITSILSKSAAFTSPAVSVNAFNRTQNADQVYISMFQPAETYRWNGNVKRYRLSPRGELLDRNGDNAVDPSTGYVKKEAWSIWSPPTGCSAPDDPDGGDVPRGGAANLQRCLVAPDDRRLFVQNTAGGTAISDLCAATTSPSPSELGLPSSATDEQVDDLVLWLCDRSAADNIFGPMGDPLHSRPALFRYDADESSLFVATNDGMIHAIDPDTGEERWSFMPKRMLARAAALEGNKALPKTTSNPTGPTPDRIYGLDGSVRVFKDIKGDDKVYLAFGMRKGGPDYFVLDVTDPDAPILKWQFDGAAEGMLQSWSTPQVTYVFDPVAQAPRPVVFFGGGYDPRHEEGYDYAETPPDTLHSADEKGAAAIYMVDLKDGTLLWRVDRDTHNAMNYAIPADIRVIDLYGADDVADRIYAADLGGQLWRFDLDYSGASNLDTNGQPTLPTSIEELMVGGRMASLGGAATPGSIEDRRRFFYAPDVAIIRDGAQVWLNVAVGSGHREFPRNDTHTDDRLYVVRDNSPFYVRTDYSTVVTESDLQDISDVCPAEATDCQATGYQDGWYLPLTNNEKILSELRTFSGQLFAVTTTPIATQGDCGLDYSLLNRLYLLSAKTGAPVQNLDRSTDGSKDMYVELALSDSISPEPVFLFPPEDASAQCQGLACRPQPTCLVGLELCPATLFNPPTRTYWKQRGMN